MAGLCGSDLHGYRGHEEIKETIVTGHEFIGEVVELGSNYSPNASGRPPLYSTLKVGDKVVSPFTSSCAECHFCRIGFTSRCKHQLLFGTAALPGGQAQYVRVPKAGGTLFVISSTTSSTPSLTSLSDTSLLLLADILPTGCFSAIQLIQHPKILPVINGRRFPLSSLSAIRDSAEKDFVKALVEDKNWQEVTKEDRVLTLAVIGLGPVGICAVVSLLDLLSSLEVEYRIVAVDLIEERRTKILEVYNALPPVARGVGEFVTASPDDATAIVGKWTNDVGCNGVLEIVGNNPALRLAYTLIRPFGVIISAGVHQSPPVPLTGRELYNKNVALEFGRCPVRNMFPMAVDLLRRRQDVFAGVGPGITLVDRVVPMESAAEAYRMFDKGECGKVIFDPWVVQAKS